MKRVMNVLKRGLAACASVCGFTAAASAAQPEPWRLGMQAAATPVADGIHGLWNLVFVIIVAVCILILVLLAYVVWRFNAKRNPTPSRTSHHTLLEIAWTAVPIIILVVIAVPSIHLLYFMDKTASADMTLKVTGFQWYWGYEYPDQGQFTFDATMVPDDKLQPGDLRLLTTDNKVVIPVDTNIRLLVTGQDVIHSWAVPAFGVRLDSIPGRINEGWIRVEHEGTYYGQCSELCGVNHAFMPIEVQAVSKEKFQAWVQDAKKKFARADVSPVQVASNPAAAN